MSIVHIITEEDQWMSHNSELFWQNNMQNILSKVRENTEVNLLLTNDHNIAQLNSKFRNQDKATNVLSFPQHENICDIDGFAGDIAMSLETIEKEALDFEISFFDHCCHLFVHGALHLLGFDHQNEKEALDMENTEINVLHYFNITNPYILHKGKHV